MIRLVKRYGSRKLYDTEESRYVSLEELAGWIRADQQIRVIDNETSDDVTTQTLAQIILEEGRRGASPVSSEMLHSLIRRGEQMLGVGVEQAQQVADRVIRAGLDRIPALRRMREETEQLRSRLQALEASLAQVETELNREPKPEAATARARAAAASHEGDPS